MNQDKRLMDFAQGIPHSYQHLKITVTAGSTPKFELVPSDRLLAKSKVFRDSIYRIDE
jgi:hypothetical protein